MQFGLEDPAAAMGILIREHLARLIRDSLGIKLEPYHDQVREASLSWLSPIELRNWHAHLAELLQSEGDTDPQRLLRHYRGAENLAAAFDCALSGAKKAENALAFEQAARLYEEALETGRADDASQASLHRKRAEALAKAGRGYESGRSYLEAARWPTHNDEFEMQRAAAEQMIRSGYLEEGTALFTALLRRSGFHIPGRRTETLLRMLALRLFIRCRGLRWTFRHETQIPGKTLRKLDLLWSGAMSLVTIDTITGSYLQALHLLYALRAGEPFRLALSLSFAAVYECMGGTREYDHGRNLIRLSQRLAERLNDPYLSAMTFGCWAGLDLIAGRISDGLSHSRTAAAGLKTAKQRGRAWESGTFNMLLIWFLGWNGRIRELSETLPQMLNEGRSHGDVYTDVCLQCSGTSHLVALAGDNPNAALAEIDHSMKQWRKSSFDLPAPLCNLRLCGIVFVCWKK